MLRCRQNDLAIVLAGPYLGFTVKVEKFVGDQYVNRIDGTQGLSHDLWIIKNRDIERELSPRRALIEDHNLQPIRGPRTDQATTTEKEIGA